MGDKEEEGKTGSAVPEYDLRGPQVEPNASFWALCPVPRVLTLKEIASIPFPEYDDPTTASGRKKIEADIDELKDLFKLRDDPGAVDGGSGQRDRLPLSRFLQLAPAPPGAVVRRERDNVTPRVQGPLVRTGRELAREFESETPGLIHHHALHALIVTRNWSPPRQALVWASLNVTIESALLAAWHFKWFVEPSRRISRRQRPVEFDSSVQVLYDTEVAFKDGEIVDGRRRTSPQPSPGTPRHPSYPSGHSTYAGAASELLSFFFSREKREFDRLADNIGMARLWAGIHYRQDHVEGMKLGRAVARRIIMQLQRSGILPMTSDSRDPGFQELARRAERFAAQCRDTRVESLMIDVDEREIEPLPYDDEVRDAEQAKGPQEGAQ